MLLSYSFLLTLRRIYKRLMKKILTLLVLVMAVGLASPDRAAAQQVSIGTNMIDWANHGTANLTVNTSVGAHLTIGVSGRYNPWFFNKGTSEQVNHAVRGGSLDLRYWPWHVYSGWWFMFKGQVMEYNYGNLHGMRFSEQGQAYGAGLGAGYTLMLGTHWNVDFGAAFWGGLKNYKKYDCSYCGKPLEAGRKGFILPDNVFVSFYYIF